LGGVSHPGFSCLLLALMERHGGSKLHILTAEKMDRSNSRKAQTKTFSGGQKTELCLEMSPENIPYTMTTASLLPCSPGDLQCKGQSQKNYEML